MSSQLQVMGAAPWIHISWNHWAGCWKCSISKR